MWPASLGGTRCWRCAAWCCLARPIFGAGRRCAQMAATLRRASGLILGRSGLQLSVWAVRQAVPGSACALVIGLVVDSRYLAQAFLHLSLGAHMRRVVPDGRMLGGGRADLTGAGVCAAIP